MQPVWTPEHVVSESLAAQLIEGQFEELIPVRVHMLGEGFDNTVYLVNDQYVFRFPRRKIAVELLETESRILPALIGHLSLPVPEPLFLGRAGSVFPWPFVGYRLVNGHTPVHISRSNNGQNAILLAEFLRALHQFPVQKAMELGVPFDTLGRVDLAKRKPRLLANLERIAELDLFADVGKLQRYVESVQESEHHSDLTLVHGDLHIRNLLVDERGLVTGIIDWGDVHIGNPALDLSVAYMFLPPEERQTFFEAYGEVDGATKELARFKSIDGLAHLLLYSHDKGSQQHMKVAQQALHDAVSE